MFRGSDHRFMAITSRILVLTSDPRSRYWLCPLQCSLSSAFMRQVFGICTKSCPTYPLQCPCALAADIGTRTLHTHPPMTTPPTLTGPSLSLTRCKIPRQMCLILSKDVTSVMGRLAERGFPQFELQKKIDTERVIPSILNLFSNCNQASIGSTLLFTHRFIGVPRCEAVHCI